MASSILLADLALLSSTPSDSVDLYTEALESSTSLYGGPPSATKCYILHRRAQIICRCLALVLLVVIAVLQPLILLVLFVLVPVFCLLVRYMYSRLAYPFVVSADANLDPNDQKHK